MMRILTVYDSRDVVSACTEHPGEELILSRLPESQLLARCCHVTAGIFDFDGTLLPGLNQWARVQQRFLSGNLAEDEDCDRSWHFLGGADFGPTGDAFWLDDEIVFDHAANEAAYAARTIFRWREAWVTIADLKRIGREMTLRKGAADVFQRLDRKIVISFGIEQLVTSALGANGLSASVAGYRLIFDRDGRVRTHHPAVVVRSVKGKIAAAWMKRNGIEAKQVLAIGDSIVDLEMMPEGGVNVLILPPGEVNRKIASARDVWLIEIWPRITCVVVSDTFMPIVGLLG